MKNLYQIIVEILESDGGSAPEFDSNSHLFEDLEFDSLKIIDLIVFIENETGFVITDDQISSITTVGDLEQIVKGAFDAED